MIDPSSAEVVVVGSGPAGASAARLLSSFGHRVTVLTRPAARPALAESIPPSATKLLAHLGWDEIVDRAGFVRSTGNTVLWGAHASGEIQETRYAGGALGYQVDRAVLNELLLDGVRRSECRVVDDVTATSVDEGSVRYAGPTGEETIRGAWVLDCSGRSGVVARKGWRRALPSQRTLALAALWENKEPWPLPDLTHTVVESHANGWAWSVPLSATQRHVTLMVDPGLTTLAGNADLAEVYRSELAGVKGLSALTHDARMIGEPFARDASPYRAHSVGRPGVLLVGDAASFVDPLSSFGIKKALASAWLAAVVVHTCLLDDAMLSPALALYETRENAMYDSLDRMRAELSKKALDGDESSNFWAARADASTGDGGEPNEELEAVLLRDDRDVRDAFLELKRRETVALAPSPGLEWIEQPTVQDDRVILQSRLALPAYPHGVRYVRGIDLARVIELAPRVTQVPDLYELYCSSVAHVPLADFLGVLSFLIGKGILVVA